MKNIACFSVFCLLACAGYGQKMSCQTITLKNNLQSTHCAFLDREKFHKTCKIVPASFAEPADNTREARQNEFRTLVLTPKMKAVLAEESQKPESEQNYLVLHVYCNQTGKVVTAEFTLSAGFMKVFPEKELKKLYRRCMKTPFNMNGVTLNDQRMGDARARTERAILSIISRSTSNLDRNAYEKLEAVGRFNIRLDKISGVE